jgi:DedD protein
MDDGLKQRLVGAIVLVAVGIIFVPSLLNQEGRREVDLATQVPPEPVVMPRPLEIPDPTQPQDIPAPKSLEDNYAHPDDPVDEEMQEEPETTIRVVENGEAVEAVEADASPQPQSVLNEEGIPQAWSIQVSSFESESNAVAFEHKLKAAGYTAYTRSSRVNNANVYRVFVGPKINRQTALATKAEIDKAFKTQAMLVEFKP